MQWKNHITHNVESDNFSRSFLQLLQNFQVQVSGQANHREDIGLEDPANDQRIISRKYKSTLQQAMAHGVWKTEEAEN